MKTHFSRSGGQKWVDSFYHPPFQTSGDIFYVDSNNGTATGPGFSPETAFSTIDAAVNATTASQGDIIVVLPGHAESITGASGVDQDVAGISIIGIGVGRKRPTITFTTANGASWDIAAAGCLVQNIAFVNGKDGQTAMMNVQAADAVIRGCEFQHGDACTQAALGILTTASADRMLVEGCHFHGTSDAGTNDAIEFVGGDSIVIRDNYFIGAYSTNGALYNVTTAGTNVVIKNNVILNQTADGDNKAIVFAAGTSGMIVTNYMAVIDSSCPAPVTAAGCYVSGNYYTGAAGVTASTLM